MSNDNKTLADVRPGGRVRLGDHLPPLPYPNYPVSKTGLQNNAYTASQMWDYARAALSAQPSPASSLDLEAMLAACVPGGDIADPQVIADSIRHWFAAQPSPGGQDARTQFEEYRGGDFERDAQGYYVNARTAQDWAMWQAALAARQPSKQQDSVALGEATEFCIEKGACKPVGQEPVIWVSPGQLAAHKDRVPGDGGAYLPARLTRDGQFTKPLYAAQPAQAVDLADFKALYRAYVRLLESGRDRIIDLGGTCDPVDVMEANDVDLQAARRILDSQAVQS